MSTTALRPPIPLVMATALVVLEGLVMGALTVAELVSVDSSRLSVGLTTAAFFALVTAALLWCAWGLVRRETWARGPLVMAQLIQLGMAYSLFDAAAPWLSVALAVVALLVVVGILHPASVRAMEEG